MSARPYASSWSDGEESIARVRLPAANSADSDARDPLRELSIPDGEGGVGLWVVDPSTYEVEESAVFDVNAFDADRALEQLQLMRDFLTSPFKMKPGSLVLGAARAPKPSSGSLHLPRRRLLFEDRISPLISDDVVSKRFTGRISMDDASVYTESKTWSGAKRHCEGQGLRLCDFRSICRVRGTGTFYSGVGRVEGLGWTPISEGANRWVSIG